MITEEVRLDLSAPMSSRRFASLYGRYTMNAPASITITPVRVADLLAEGERMPVYVHVIDHPDGRVLVDTGMTELHPAVADMDPRLRPLSEQDFDLAGIDIVVNTHLHFDHCGGNHRFAGRPIYVQRRELDDARSEDDYTIREWVEAPGVQYVPVDGELELLPGLRLVPAPGHTRGMQLVVVETGERPIVVGGDVAVWFGELDEPETEASCGCARSTPSWSGSPTYTSRGGRAPDKHAAYAPLLSGAGAASAASSVTAPHDCSIAAGSGTSLICRIGEGRRKAIPRSAPPAPTQIVLWTPIVVPRMPASVVPSGRTP